ncbi:outer membrane lipoprotein carrier protein LolA [Mesorhizobium sp. C416B]|jgi:outer membrane lipoprotein-sorting protein|uniref:LolA family protein n=1 Tax=unclassified Mesorhizobium TaxID=325217 RepID=UPI0003CF3F48|nr:MULTISPECIES: outer membrane lipoprotein carrier protein LolA [unclassified Mesorhizobium]ESX07582.1 membrane protein [Mesorhizobium sp. LSJC265A00]ESX50867.1 membrane protein [Mesorhizobium sp. LSHC426A00]ESX53994.1 membrane protein [Mesorhizobium sp. LSHC424B00]ESX67996.1 membrane protein [Mesorhizobium sp. LSHC416B00]ESZ57656.1 membrane protein [Mesorhizobium sp. L103C131B0]
MAYNSKRLLAFWLAVVSAVAINAELSTAALAAPVEAKTIADHFSSVKSMSGDFVQSGPRAERTKGKFFLQRPGKIRFNYAGQSGVSVIADGKSLVVYNKKLKTSRLYALSKTPLKLLLDNQVNFSGNRLKSIRDDGAQVIIRLADKSAFGNSNITMVFDRESLDLRRWTLTDERGLTSTVTISNVKQGVRAPAGTFTIDYAANREFNTKTK